MTDLKWLSVVVFSLLMNTTNSFADGSSLPPGLPETAIQLGTLDVPAVSTRYPNQKLYKCFYKAITLRSVGQLPQDSQYFRFNIDHPNTRLSVAVQEAPQTTMWVAVRTAQLVLMPPLERGADNENFFRLLQPGTYYLQLITGAEQRHLPDGTNIGLTTIRAVPDSAYNPQGPDTVNLGTLSPGGRIEATGELGWISGRESLSEGSSDCKLGGSAVIDDLSDDFIIQSGPGRIKAAFNREAVNWPQDKPLLVYYLKRGLSIDTWERVPDAGVDHNGGELRFRVGMIDQISILLHDFFVSYSLTLTR